MNCLVGVIEFGLLVQIKILIQDKKEIRFFQERMLKLKERFLLKDLLRTLVMTLVSTKALQKLPITSLRTIKPLNGLVSN